MRDIEAFEQARLVIQGEIDQAARLRKDLAACEQLLDTRVNELMVARHELEEAKAAHAESERVIARLTDTQRNLAILDERIAALKELQTLEAACCSRAERHRDALLAALELCVNVIPNLEVRSWPPGWALKDKALKAARAAIAGVRS